MGEVLAEGAGMRCVAGLDEEEVLEILLVGGGEAAEEVLRVGLVVVTAVGYGAGAVVGDWRKGARKA